ncbi:hypothetical protein CLIB1423_18S02190 [[Candida] railenensis]|uniref:Uncharacterized protein n=1 Tax=[Candida] railenensis TaxID=45579 RepID=A0A9P0W078_9ASCO|nr:hypothetical protein CLIB1423_18S02190 [[Candida] railenensis]
MNIEYRISNIDCRVPSTEYGFGNGNRNGSGYWILYYFPISLDIQSNTYKKALNRGRWDTGNKRPLKYLPPTCNTTLPQHSFLHLEFSLIQPTLLFSLPTHTARSDRSTFGCKLWHILCNSARPVHMAPTQRTVHTPHCTHYIPSQPTHLHTVHQMATSSSLTACQQFTKYPPIVIN